MVFRVFALSHIQENRNATNIHSGNKQPQEVLHCEIHFQRGSIAHSTTKTLLCATLTAQIRAHAATMLPDRGPYNPDQHSSPKSECARSVRRCHLPVEAKRLKEAHQKELKGGEGTYDLSIGSTHLEMTAYAGNSFYLGRSKELKPLDLPASSPTRQYFYKKATDRDSAQIKALWARLTFTGQGTAPKELTDAAAVKKAVAADPKAVGYILSSDVDSTVKVILTLN